VEQEAAEMDQKVFMLLVEMERPILVVEQEGDPQEGELTVGMVVQAL
jgi:hypothetical protein